MNKTYPKIDKLVLQFLLTPPGFFKFLFTISSTIYSIVISTSKSIHPADVSSRIRIRTSFHLQQITGSSPGAKSAEHPDPYPKFPDFIPCSGGVSRKRVVPRIPGLVVPWRHTRKREIPRCSSCCRTLNTRFNPIPLRVWSIRPLRRRRVRCIFSDNCRENTHGAG